MKSDVMTTCEGSVRPMGIQVPDVGFVWARFAEKYRDESSGDLDMAQGG